MEFTMDIDTGGTFTEGFVRGDGRIELIKVDTTHHDLTVCFMECIEEAAKKFGLQSASQLLTQMNTLRLSTTIGTNTLIKSSGPKLGLLATRGPGENAYAPVGNTNPAVDFIVPRDMIIGIDEELSESGVSIRAPLQSQVLAGVKTLLERGARKIVVSLRRAALNPAHERMCQEMVVADYPTHYLGTVPLLLSTEVSSERDDLCRTNVALIDAYLHQEMAHYLYKADEDVRNRRYKWPLLIVHATGGVARVAKTRAIDTCDSGPASGLYGAAFLARLYDMENVVTLDVGGTSTDVGFVAHGEPHYTNAWDLGGIPVKGSVIETSSIGGGGGSIARADDKTGKVRVGPDSAESIPGPACYGLGGTNATVTDAWVTLGYIDPNYFLGGRRKLDVALAKAAVKTRVADPLNITVEEAASAIDKEICSLGAQLVRKFINAKGAKAEDVTLFAFGGAGGLTCSGVARAVGIPKIYLFPFGSQFCAFGSSCMDVLHNYSMAKSLTLGPNTNNTTIQEFNRAVREMVDGAYFDLVGEGFGKEKVSLVLEIIMTSGHSPSPTVIRWLPIFLENKKTVGALLDLYRAQVGGVKDSEVLVQELRLKASSPLTRHKFPSYTSAGANPKKALKGQRPVYWDGKFRDTQIYEQSLLKCGNVVKGLAIIECPGYTILVPPGSRYLTDQYLNGVIEEE